MSNNNNIEQISTGISRMDNLVFNENVVVSVTRGEELPKKSFEKRLHPTYETNIRVKIENQWTDEYTVVGFYDGYRVLHDSLSKVANDNTKIHSPFPPRRPRITLGQKLSEEMLQARCYMLSEYMIEVFQNFHNFSTNAQVRSQR